MAACCALAISPGALPDFGRGAGLKQQGVGTVLVDVEHQFGLAQGFVDLAELEPGLAQEHSQLELARAARRGLRCRLGPCRAACPWAAYNRARRMAPMGEVLDSLSISRVSSMARGKSPRRATMSHSA